MVPFKLLYFTSAFFYYSSTSSIISPFSSKYPVLKANSVLKQIVFTQWACCLRSLYKLPSIFHTYINYHKLELKINVKIIYLNRCIFTWRIYQSLTSPQNLSDAFGMTTKANWTWLSGSIPNSNVCVFGRTCK